MDGGPEALAEMSFTTIVQFASHPSPHDPQFVIQLDKIRAESWCDATRGSIKTEEISGASASHLRSRVY